jgi:CRP-like cAMP-binding protein
VSLEDRAAQLRRELFLRALSLAKPSPAAARTLAQAITDVEFDPGQVIFRRGDEADAAYFIVEGQVTLEAPDEEPWTFRNGGVVGILDVNLERPRARTCVADTHVRAMMLRGEDWLEMMEDNFEYTVNARRSVAMDLHRLVLEIAPSGGFTEPRSTEHDLAAVELNAVARLVVLRNVETFARASVQALARLAAVSEPVALRPTEVLFEPGQAHDRLFVVAFGIVDVTRVIEPVIEAGFGSGQLVGGSPSLGGVLADYRAVARTRATVLTFTTTELEDVAEDHFDLTRSLIRHLAVERERVMRARARARASIAPPPVSDAVPVRGVRSVG